MLAKMTVLLKTHEITLVADISGVRSVNRGSLRSELTAVRNGVYALVSSIEGVSGVRVSTYVKELGFIAPFETVLQGSSAFKKRGKEKYMFNRRNTSLYVLVSYVGGELSQETALKLKNSVGGIFSYSTLGALRSVKLAMSRYNELRVI